MVLHEIRMNQPVYLALFNIIIIVNQLPSQNTHHFINKRFAYRN